MTSTLEEEKQPVTVIRALLFPEVLASTITVVVPSRFPLREERVSQEVLDIALHCAFDVMTKLSIPGSAENDIFSCDSANVQALCSTRTTRV